MASFQNHLGLGDKALRAVQLDTVHGTKAHEHDSTRAVAGKRCSMHEGKYLEASSLNLFVMYFFRL